MNYNYNKMEVAAMDLNCSKFYYNDLTNLIVKEIKLSLLKGDKCHEGYVSWPYSYKLDSDAQIVHWVYSVFRSKKPRTDRWDIHAWSGVNEYSEPSIELAFLLKKGIWTKKNGIDLPELSNVVAHELHHLTQFEDYCEKKPENLASYEYFLLPCEKEAFHIGFRAQSNISGKSIEQCMLDYLKPRKKTGDLTQQQVNKVVDAWLNVEWKLSHNSK